MAILFLWQRIFHPGTCGVHHYIMGMGNKIEIPHSFTY